MTKLTKTDKQSNDLTAKEEFKPTPHMRVWFDMTMQIMSDSPTEIEQACKDAGTPISRQAFHLWMKDERFITWFKEQWDKRLAGHSWKLDAIGLKNAKRDFKYWEGMQKRVGNLKDDKTPAIIQQNFNVHANNELKEFE